MRAIGGNVVVRKFVMVIKQNLGGSRIEVWLCLYGNSHHLVAGAVEKFSAISCPSRLKTSLCGDLYSVPRTGKGLNINLGAAGLLGLVGDPPPIRRKHTPLLGRIGFEPRLCFALLDSQDPHIKTAPARIQSVHEEQLFVC